MFLMLLGFLISIIIARSLGPEIQGKYALFILTPTLLYNLGNLGIGSSTVYLLNNEKEKQYSYLKFILKLTLVMALVNTIIGTIIAVIYFNFASINFSSYELIVVSLLTPILLINNIMLFIFQALKRFDLFSFNSVLPKLIQIFLLLIVICFFNNNLILSLLIFISSNFLSLMYALFVLKKILKRIPKTYEKINKKMVLTYGLKTHLANTITLVNYRLDQLLIGFFINSYSVGIYNVAVIIVEKVWSLTNPLITVLFPEMASMKNLNERKEITCKITRILNFFNMFIGVGFLIVMKPLIILSFGQEYESAILIANILLIGILAMNIDKVLSNDIASLGKPEINMRITNMTFVLNLLLALILLPKFGLIGAAIATTSSYFITLLLKIKAYAKIYSIKYREMLIITKTDFKYLISLVARKGA